MAFANVGDSLFDTLDFGVAVISVIRLSVDIDVSILLAFFLTITGLFFVSKESTDKPISVLFCLKEGDSGLVIPQLLLIESFLLPVRLAFASVKLSDERAFTSFLTGSFIFANGFLSIARFIAGLEVRDESDEEIIILRRCCTLILSGCVVGAFSFGIDLFLGSKYLDFTCNYFFLLFY